MALSLLNGRRGNSLWDPFLLETAWDPFDGLVHIAPDRSFALSAGAITGINVDWLETADAHVFKAELPGLKKEAVKVELEDGRVLKISGELSHEERKEGDRWHTVERSRGKFLRRFKLPENAHTDSISAKVEDGILNVTVPKADKPPEKKTIAVA